MGNTQWERRCTQYGKRTEKAQGGIEALKELEAITDTEIKKLNGIRKEEFGDELDAGYFFSVVFDTRKERDLWLKEHNLNLVENFFIRAKDFKL